MTENPETHAGCGFQADSQNEDLLKILVLDEFSKISIATTSFSQKSSCFQKQVKPKLGVACRGFRWSTTYNNDVAIRTTCEVAINIFAPHLQRSFTFCASHKAKHTFIPVASHDCMGMP